jgi:molybdopterin-containing oxidoreductase family iron-sulfur binding subunit
MLDLPPLTPYMDGPVDRRQALALLATGASIALASCSPAGTRVAFVSRPGVTGETVERYATTLALGGYGIGVTALVRDGRPVKIEGNPHHGASLGATNVFTEAAILDLYDPQRSQVPRGPRGPATWRDIDARIKERLDAEEKTGGAGLVLMTGRITSPTLLRQMTLARARFPEMLWTRFEPLSDDSERRGMELAFGRYLQAVPNLAAARAIISLDADFLGPGPEQIRLARGFATGRTGDNLSRLTVFESCLTQTGASADRRSVVHPTTMPLIAAALAAAIGMELKNAALPPDYARAVSAAIADLRRGGGIVLAGARQPPEVHALCAAINQKLGAPLRWIEPADPHPDGHMQSLARLCDRLRAGEVSTLITLDSNPVYCAPQGLHFSDLMAKAGWVVHAGRYFDETARRARLHAPLSHPMETWSDARAITGEPSLTQPLIDPLYDTRSPHQVMTWLTGETSEPPDLIAKTWASKWNGDFATKWRDALATGIVNETSATVEPPAANLPALSFSGPEPLMLVLSPSPSVWDGDRASNAWLQECPHPLSKETWGASLAISERDASSLDLKTGDVVLLTRGEASIAVPVRLSKHQAERVVQLDCGHGRTLAGPIGSGVGVSAYALQGEDAGLVLPGIQIVKTGKHAPVPSTRRATTIEGLLDELYPLARPPNLGVRREETGEGFYPPKPTGERAWAMVIDAAACIGCNACVMACQSENNLALIGPGEIARQRDMHWLRIDIHEPDDERPGGFQPVPCMHCEEAPCEPVCPVEASVHDREGLNLQVYNRCIGTRFCQANCPYKVRRFNFHAYDDLDLYRPLDPAPIQAMRNPDVSVRTRGVMEKCTYCVQRIVAARIKSDSTDQPIADGDVKTACQQACPTQAIHFGDKADTASDVAQLQSHPRRYALLGKLGTRPRTTYLARVWNPGEPDADGEAM